MLDAYIIDWIQREERERRPEESDGGRAHLELPVPGEDLRHRPADEPRDEEADRGVVIIPLNPEVPLREAEAA
jgi:hypothetical protein